MYCFSNDVEIKELLTENKNTAKVYIKYHTIY